MKWSVLFVILAGACAIVNVVRGVIVYDGVALLAVAFLALAVLAAFLGRAVERKGRR